MTLPNKLTLSRILIIPIFLFCLLFEQLAPQKLWTVGIFRVIALILIIIASITDYYDGKVARQLGLTTTLGKLLDPLADKLLVASAFIAFVDIRVFPGWLVIIILFREFLVTGLRSIGAAQGRVVQADRWGKHKTGWQLATIITAIAFLAARDFFRASGLWNVPLVKSYYADIIFNGILLILIWICVFLSVYSGAVYVWRHRDLLQEDPPSQNRPSPTPIPISHPHSPSPPPTVSH